MGVACFVLASSSRSIHSHLRHSCWQKLMLKEEGSRRQMMYMSDFPKAPGCWCCCLMLKMDLNSDLMPVSSKTSRTAVSPMSSPGLARPPGNFHAFTVCIGGKKCYCSMQPILFFSNMKEMINTQVFWWSCSIIVTLTNISKALGRNYFVLANVMIRDTDGLYEILEQNIYWLKTNCLTIIRQRCC